MRAFLICGLALAASAAAGVAMAQAPTAKVGMGLPINCPAQLTMSARVPMIFPTPQQLYIFDRVELTGDKARCIYLNNNTGQPLNLDAKAASCRALAPQAWQKLQAGSSTLLCFNGPACTLSCG